MATATSSSGIKHDFLSVFLKHRNLTALTREVLVELVDRIYVHEGGMLTIRLRFADAFAQAADFIDTNRSCKPTACRA